MAQGVYASSLPLPERAALLREGQARLVGEDSEHFLDRETRQGYEKGALLGAGTIGTVGALNLLGDRSLELLKKARQRRSADMLRDAVNERFRSPEEVTKFRKAMVRELSTRLRRDVSPHFPVDPNPTGFGARPKAFSRADARQIDALFPERQRIVVDDIQRRPGGGLVLRPHTLTGPASIAQAAARRAGGRELGREIALTARAASALTAEKPADHLIRRAHAPVDRAWQGLSEPFTGLSRGLDRLQRTPLAPLAVAGRLLNRRMVALPLAGGAAGAVLGRRDAKQTLEDTHRALEDGEESAVQRLRKFDRDRAAERVGEMDLRNPLEPLTGKVESLNTALAGYPESVANALLYTELGMI